MRTFDKAVPPQRLARLEIGADNGTLQFLDAAGRGAFADEAFRNMVLRPVLPAQVALVDDVAEVQLLCRDQHAVGRWRGGAAAFSGGFERLARTAALIPATRATPRTARRAVFIFIVMVCLSYVNCASSRFERLPPRFRTQRRGGPRKTGSGLQHANANLGLKRLFQFPFLL